MEKDLVLVKLDAARNALTEAKTIQDTKKVYDAATATLIFAKRQKAGKEIEQQVTAFMVDALKQLGDMLKNTPKNEGARGYGKSGVTNQYPTLDELGLDKKTSALAQQVASLSSDDLDKVRAGVEKISDAIHKDKIAKAHERFAEQTNAKQIKPATVELCDAIDWLNKSPMCDLLLTDAVYMTEVEDILEFAQWLTLGLSKVKPTGRAYVFIGAYPQEVAAYLSVEIPSHIELSQILIWTYKNTLGNNPKDRYKLNYQMCLYYKGVDAPDLDCPLTNEQWAVQEINAPDGRLGDRYHAWQKPIEIAERFIRHSTKPGDVVLDPFTCTGTFILAASILGRVGLGCDNDKANLEIAIERGCIYA